MADVTLGLALIARDEAENLPNLLASIVGAFDRVVLVDTGSKDKTVAIFDEWAATEVGAGRLDSYHSDTFEWVHDFSAARTYAHSLLDTDWEIWADCDDVLQGATNLRKIAENANPEICAFVANYAYAHDEHGNVVCQLKRERMVRRGEGEWLGRVHEAQHLQGPVEMLPEHVVNWVHRKPPTPDTKRNLKILRKWNKEEPGNPRVLGYLGTEELSRGRHKHAIRYFKQYLALGPGWDEERAQMHRKYAMALMALGDHQGAIDTAMQAIQLLPLWPDNYITLSEAHYNMGEVGKAIVWADEVLKRGVPDTMLIIDPTDYVLRPRVVRAGSFAAVGQVDQALEETQLVYQHAPGHPALAPHVQKWQETSKINKAVESALTMAQNLVSHDEQLKALAVLEAVPHFATDHPQIVGHRAELRRRINELTDPQAYADHYETGGTKPEDFVDDPIAIGDVLPRCEFLLEGLLEQAGIEPAEAAA